MSFLLKKSNQIIPSGKIYSLTIPMYEGMFGGELFKITQTIPYKYFPCFDDVKYFEKQKPSDEVETTMGSINASVSGMVNTKFGSVGMGRVNKSDEMKFEWEFLHKGDILMYLFHNFDIHGHIYPRWLITCVKTHLLSVRVIPILHGAYKIEKIASL